MKKYTTKPIDFTGCHPVIAEHLKRGEAIECRVWSDLSGESRTGYVIGFSASNLHRYRCDNEGVSVHRHAEPIPIKAKRIMPPERAIPVLIAEGWKFRSSGSIVGPSSILTPYQVSLMGTSLDGEAGDFRWPPCIIEEVDCVKDECNASALINREIKKS